MKDRIYIELQRHGHNEESVAEPALLKLADETGLPLVATNDNHFEDAAMQIPQNVLTCIASSLRISQLERPVHNAEYRFKTAAEMTELFADIPEAIKIRSQSPNAVPLWCKHETLFCQPSSQKKGAVPKMS